jgi:hypothetical protein
MGSACSCKHKGESHAVRMPAQTGRENVHTHTTHFCFVMLTRFTVVAWPEVLIKGTRLVTRPKKLKSRHAGCALSGGGGSNRPPTSPCNALVRGDGQHVDQQASHFCNDAPTHRRVYIATASFRLSGRTTTRHVQPT